MDMLKMVYIYGFEQKLTENRKFDDRVLSHAFAPGEAAGAAVRAIKRRNIVNEISWYVPHSTSEKRQEAILSKHIISRAPME